MKKSLFFILLCFVFTLTACANNNTPTPVAEVQVSETATRPPTSTPLPTTTNTATPMPTVTDEPTATATATSTPSPTATATATATPTPTELPPTPTPTMIPTASGPTATPRPVSPLAGGSPPSGPNLLVNPGFETGSEGWAATRGGSSVAFYNTNDYSNFIRSGQQSAYHREATVFVQYVSGLTVGTTYRFGAWGKLWSSTGTDRTISENPLAGLFMQVCIGTAGDGDPFHTATVCSSRSTPFDSWQYIYVDAIAASERVAVVLFTNTRSCCMPQNSDAVWDDAAFGLAPASATPTPSPYVPVRPNPIPFNGPGLRDNMVSLRSNLQNLGGLLDRLAHGQGGTCQEFFTFYNALVTITTYSGIPEGWQGIYNDYLYAADHAIETNTPINDLCKRGTGTLSQIAYGVARTGVNESIDRLSPAIDAANALLGQ